MLDMPYFMSNPEWYYFNGKKFVLTDKAPEEAKQSLVEFYQDEDEILKSAENNHTNK